MAQSIEHAKLYSQAQRRVEELEALAKISEAVSESLYLEESLEAIVKTTMDAVSATGAALVLEDGKIAWPEGRAGAHAVRHAAALEAPGDRRARRRPRHAVHRRGTGLLASIAHHAAVALEHGRAVMRGVLAQEIHHRVKNNLQTVASLLRLQARATTVDPQRALDDSVNRILAIAAVHEVLTERRDESVDLGDLIERLRAMLVQGLGRARSSRRRSLRSRSRAAVRRHSRSSSRSSCRTRSSTAARRCASSSAQRNGDVTLAIADDGGGIAGAPRGTGLSIVDALVRDELGGTLSLEDEGGLRPRSSSRPRRFAGSADELPVGRLVRVCGGRSSVTVRLDEAASSRSVAPARARGR